MIEKKNPNYLPNLSKVVELRTSSGTSVTESVHNVDLLLNNQVSHLGQYKRVQVDNEWLAFKKLISQ